MNFLDTLRQALLALALAATSLAASAGVIPTYHVTIDTSAAAGVNGALDFNFSGLNGPAGLATISNLAGAVNGVDGFSFGDWQEMAPLSSYTLASVPDTYLSLFADFGGSFSFDLAFTGDFLVNPSNIVSMFTVFALDRDNNFAPVGGKDFAVQFALFPVSDIAGPSVGVDVDGRIAQVQAVPEPSDLLMVFTGLVLLGAVLRRRQA